MEFKKLLGTRIYLELPEEPKSNLVLDEASKAELEKEKLKTYGRLKVYAVGNGVEHIVPGDEVMIDPSSAARGVPSCFASASNCVTKCCILAKPLLKLCRLFSSGN